MLQLSFDPEKCLACESMSCLKKCIHLNYNDARIKEEIKKLANGEYSSVLDDCTNCYGCEENCPYDNHMFYRIVELQEKFDVRKVSDSVREELIKRYEPEGEFVPKSVGGKFVHICLFPHLKDLVYKGFFDGFEVVRGRHLFCNVVYLHYGMISVIKERIPVIIENMKKLEAEIFVFFHDECYGFYNSLLRAYGVEVPFRYVHLFEYLRDFLKANSPKKLDIDVIYQRPCSNRLSPHIDKVVDEVFELIGVRRVNRYYDRDRALCCGASFVLSKEQDKVAYYRDKQKEDMFKFDTSWVIFNCPMCKSTLEGIVLDLGKKPLMLIELCKMALE
ncbi:MAG: heterodisulfide reductase-related iron-sulfur binding cluster [Thermosulfidibacteraceae bacterium]|jgi:Fe-S oxidoreductase